MRPDGRVIFSEGRSEGLAEEQKEWHGQEPAPHFLPHAGGGLIGFDEGRRRPARDGHHGRHPVCRAFARTENVRINPTRERSSTARTGSTKYARNRRTASGPVHRGTGGRQPGRRRPPVRLTK